jgi:cytochrome c553
MNTRIQTLLAVGILSLSSNTPAVDVNHGKTLQQQNCMACHDDGMYTRDARKVTTLGGLHKQVKRCELTLGLKWFDEDINDVAAYLNESFYKFK